VLTGVTTLDKAERHTLLAHLFHDFKLGLPVYATGASGASGGAYGASVGGDDDSRSALEEALEEEEDSLKDEVGTGEVGERKLKTRLLGCLSDLFKREKELAKATESLELYKVHFVLPSWKP
jgi:hypothetical protein